MASTSSKSGFHDFGEFFRCATGNGAFPFQRDFAGEGRNDWRGENGLPALVDVPTGLGKTAMVVLGWLWRRRFAAESVRWATPRRLIYCLPMRVLVEQTRDNAKYWLKPLGLLVPEGYDGRHDDSRIAVDVLMGGEDEGEWDIHPERDAIIIGTQDMLLSRALNRGYAASRARWPMHFGLLNVDCLWVFDEIQLMGSGLATTTQLDAFRRQFVDEGAMGGAAGLVPNGCASVWMSATLRTDWLKTVDFKDRIDERQKRINGKATLSLSEEDHTNMQVQARWNASKPLLKSASGMGDSVALAEEIMAAHRQACAAATGDGTRTLVVVNTVKRACELFTALKKTVAVKAGGTKAKKDVRGGKHAELSAITAAASEVLAMPKFVLLHSRFRPPDRARRVAEALADVDPSGLGTIIVSTQVIEAGVDVSAATLFTELAPWASLVQRFGRCNRRGELNGLASVRWIDLPAGDKAAEKMRRPYELADLQAAVKELANLTDVGIGSLEEHRRTRSEEALTELFPYTRTHVIRRKDVLELFDTTPDLAGHDIDIDRYVREVEETDVRVFWRDDGDPQKRATPNAPTARAGGEETKRAEPAPRREELCSVPLGDFKAYVKERRGLVWRWNFTEKQWESNPEAIAPGQVFLLHVSAGGYSSERGWTGDANDTPTIDAVLAAQEAASPDSNEADRQEGQWQELHVHTDAVCGELERVLGSLSLSDRETGALRHAARWHDAGKAHAVFQAAVKDDDRPPDYAGLRTIAKAPSEFWRRYERRHFRHELASALTVLRRPHEGLASLDSDELNLVAYLVAAHHGKVRQSIRSMPNETKPPAGRAGEAPSTRYARGVWDGDVLPGVNLGGADGGVAVPAVTLSLEPMEMGLCEAEPFAGQPSWVERVLRLRDRLGPFRLAYLEAILRAADERASAAAAKSVEVNHV